MNIYKAEKAIANLIKENNKIVCAAKIERATSEDILRFKPRLDKYIKAEITDEDVFYHKAILVSSVVNKNLDIFMPEDMWAARKTPIDKPANLKHIPSAIVGHMVNSWCVDSKGELIPEDTSIDDLPSKMHILAGYVIYKNFHEDENRQQEVDELIDAINKEEMMVSMEVLLKGFDYGLISEDGLKIVERTKDTSFLSKYLSAYGGPGEYNGQKIGRIVRNLNFCASGYVKNPANPDSYIFTSKDIFDFANASIIEKNEVLENNGVVSISDKSKGDKLMSEVLQEQNKEFKDLIKAQTDKIEKLEAELAKKDVAQFEAKIVSLTENAEQLTAKLAAKDEAVDTYKASADKLSKEIEELTKSNEELKVKLAEFESKEKAAARISDLVKAGLSQEDAEAKAAKFSVLNDEQFKVVAEEIGEAALFMKKNKKEEEKSEKKESGKAELEEAEPEDKNIEVTAEEVLDDKAKAEEIRANLSKAMASALKVKLDGDK